jgi:hypothetical protein
MSDPTLYLLSQYTGREAESLKENQDAWLALDQKGYTVYSPICENHNIEAYRKRSHFRCPCCKHEISEDGFKSGFGGCHCATWIKDQYRFYIDLSDIDEKCKNNTHIAEPIYNEPDYVERDLRKLAGWLKNDGNEFLHQGCGGVVHDIGGDQGMCFKCREYCDLKTTELYNHYDSGVIGVVLPSAFELLPDPTGDDSGYIMNWKSKGAQQEYEFCKQHNILVIPLEIALTVPRDQWREYGL